MSLSTKDFVTLVTEQIQNIQGSARAIVDFTIGSIMRAIVEANAAIVLWLQGLILQLLAITRAATSSGADLDSWVNDFGVTRLAAVAAGGQVTFARFTPTNVAFIPVGATVQTADGTQQYSVVVDTANPNYSPQLGGYTVLAGVGSIGVPVRALVAGAAGNAGVGLVNTLATAISFIDTVTNATGFTNGANAESDAALRTRFIQFIQSLAKATKLAIGYAITSLKQGISYTLTENQNYAGASQNGYFYVVVDDGSGTPSAGFLNQVAQAVDAVRGFTITFGVFAPTLLTANVVMTATIASGYDPIATRALVAAAIAAYIGSLTIGADLTYSRLAQIAYDASPGVINVTLVTLNGGTADLIASDKQRITTGTVAVS